jgi:hypothetical protein
MKITIINCFEALNQKGRRVRCPFCVERDNKYDEFYCNLTGKDIELTDNENELEAKGICYISAVEIKVPVSKKDDYEGIQI